MKILIFIAFILLFSFDANASVIDGISGFFSAIAGYFEAFWVFVTEKIPTIIGEFLTWLISYVLYLKFSAMLAFIEFSHSVAKTFLELIDISSIINTAISALPQDMRQIAVDVRFFEALTLVVEAWVTRLVYTSF